MNKNNIISDWLDKYGEPEIDKKVGMKLEEMNKEKYNQIIDDAYKNYRSKSKDIDLPENLYYNLIDDLNKNAMFPIDNPSRMLSQEKFINKCKTDLEFSEKWGLKIEERELNTQERNEWFQVHLNGNNPFMKSDWKDYELDQQNIPTKLITLEYNNEKTYYYE